jgi:hypothetical protein
VKLIKVESPRKLSLWQFRLRSLYNYSFITVCEEVEMGQLVKILKQKKLDGVQSYYVMEN